MKFILFSLFVALYVHLNDAAFTRPSATDLNAARNQGLIAHNTYRKLHQAPPLILDSNLNSIAQNYAESLANQASLVQPVHSSTSHGENLFAQITTGTLFTPAVATKSAVDNWFKEVKDYAYTNPVYSLSTSHFTQVVWKSTAKVGFGVASAKKMINGIEKSTLYVVANYSPAGNVKGIFAANVLKPL